jgi:DNA-binding transcriptional LysR family regulator
VSGIASGLSNPHFSCHIKISYGWVVPSSRPPLLFQLAQIETFVAIARESSFTRAAERLGLTQPRVSARILKLESLLGFALFKRGRTPVLTDAGRAFLESAEALLEASQRTENVALKLRGAQAQRLRLGAVPVHAWRRWQMLQSFMARYPNVHVEVEVMASSAALAGRLARGDIALAFAHDNEATRGFERRHILRAGYGVISPAGAAAPPASLEDLRGRMIGLFRRELHPDLHDRMTDLLSSAGIRHTDLPEVSEDGIQNFVRRMKIPVISFEVWDETNKPADLAFSRLAGLDLALDFYVMKRPEGDRLTELLWRHCEAFDADITHVTRTEEGAPRPLTDHRGAACAPSPPSGSPSPTGGGE